MQIDKLNEELLRVNEDIKRAENNIRVANSKLDDLLKHKQKIESAINLYENSNSIISILDNAQAKEDIQTIKTEIIKARELIVGIQKDEMIDLKG